MCIYIYIYLYICMCVYIFIYMYVFIYIFIYIFIYLNVCVYMYIFIYVCVCVFCTHIFVNRGVVTDHVDIPTFIRIRYRFSCYIELKNNSLATYISFLIFFPMSYKNFANFGDIFKVYCIFPIFINILEDHWFGLLFWHINHFGLFNEKSFF